jgi:septin family protein
MTDYLIMKELQNVVNVIPIIGRGGPSREEILKTKNKIKEDTKTYQIEFFNVEESVKVLALKLN